MAVQLGIVKPIDCPECEGSGRAEPAAGASENPNTSSECLGLPPPPPREHELKCWPAYFRYVRDGVKPFELRQNDRDFQVGDHVRLREWDANRPVGEEYTGEELTRRIGYVLRGPSQWGLAEGYAILGFAELAREGSRRPPEVESPSVSLAALLRDLHDHFAAEAEIGVPGNDAWKWRDRIDAALREADHE